MFSWLTKIPGLSFFIERHLGCRNLIWLQVGSRHRRIPGIFTNICTAGWGIVCLQVAQEQRLFLLIFFAGDAVVCVREKENTWIDFLQVYHGTKEGLYTKGADGFFHESRYLDFLQRKPKSTNSQETGDHVTGKWVYDILYRYLIVCFFSLNRLCPKRLQLGRKSGD